MMKDTSTQKVIEMVWRALKEQVRAAKRDTAKIRVRYERAEQSNGVPRRTYAQAQAQIASGGCGGGDLLWIINACNPDAETGVGALCWFDPGSNVWRRVKDDAAVTECVGAYLTDDEGAALLSDDGILLTE
jgi:hypothetical protein